MKALDADALGGGHAPQFFFDARESAASVVLLFGSKAAATAGPACGSGDAFLATFLSSYLQQQPIPEALKRACAVGAFVATRPGATRLGCSRPERQSSRPRPVRISHSIVSHCYRSLL